MRFRANMVRKHPGQILIAVLLMLCFTQSCRRAPSRPEVAASTPVNNPGMVLIKGGTFLMGTNDGMPYEAPAHEVAVNPFWMDEHEVTVAEFARFVAATGYHTDAEKLGWAGG